MKVTTWELWVINLVLQIDKEWKARQFPFAKLKQALDIFEKLKVNVKEDKFIDGELKLTSEEKVFIKELLEEREFGVIDAPSVFSLIDKIK